jgi:MFS family permease
MSRFGGRRTMLYAGFALLIDLVSIGLAPNVPLLMLAVLMLGITASSFDVAINSVASKHEKASGKSQMATLHAWGCAGGLAGAMLSSVMASMQVAPAQHFAMIASLALFGLWTGCRMLGESDSGEVIEKKAFSFPRGSLLLLGALGFFGSIAEGSIADWSGIFLKDHFGVADGFAPLALTTFSVMMLLTRLTGDRLKGKYGARRLLSAGGILAATGLACAVLAPTAHFALGGFALAGLGMALVFPFVFSAAGKEGPVALGGVATMAYSGSLMGPPMLGALAQNLGMQAAMSFIGVLCVVISVIASRSVALR